MSWSGSHMCRLDWLVTWIGMMGLNKVVIPLYWRGWVCIVVPRSGKHSVLPEVCMYIFLPQSLSDMKKSTTALSHSQPMWQMHIQIRGPNNKSTLWCMQKVSLMKGHLPTKRCCGHSSIHTSHSCHTHTWIFVSYSYVKWLQVWLKSIRLYFYLFLFLLFQNS